jgi:hypothetical protein
MARDIPDPGAPPLDPGRAPVGSGPRTITQLVAENAVTSPFHGPHLSGGNQLAGSRRIQAPTPAR